MEADHYESLLRQGAAAIEHARLLQRSAEVLREERAIAATAPAVVADSRLVIDLLLDHVLCDRCMAQRAEVSPARLSAVWQELARRFSSAKIVGAVCEECGEDRPLLRLAA